MKIGIFGDSYAEKKANQTAWWRRLQLDHGHQVKSFGEGGSSILYSAGLLQNNHAEFDFNIWCLTTPGRFSIRIPGSEDYFHSANFMDTQGRLTSTNSIKHKSLIDFCQGYLRYVFDWNDEKLVGRALASHLLSIIPNLMIIPCFPDPIDNGFNLFDLCSIEIEKVLPGQEIWEIYKSYQDIRACHLSSTNNKILADTINANLIPGLFFTDYKIFEFENIAFSDILQKR